MFGHEQREVSKKLWNALRSLSEDEFDFVNLHFFEGYSLAEIAEMYSLTYISCWRLRKAILKKLREILSDNE